MRHRRRSWARAVQALVIALGWLAAGRARADDCYRARAGTRLFAEPMLQTPVATVTADVVGWFGRRDGDDPGTWLRFVELDGDALVTELDVYANPAELTAVTCPTTTWERPLDLVELSWPDGRPAGTMAPATLARRRRKAKVAYGRACFDGGLAAIPTTACAAVKPARPSCVAVQKGASVFARPDARAAMGTTTARVYAREPQRIDAFTRVVLFDATDRELAAYVRPRDLKPRRCPATSGDVSTSSIPPFEALLPDGTDAGFRIDTVLSLVPDEEVHVGADVLFCRDESPIDDVALRVCHRRVIVP